ncbi:MAG: putative phage abortive infection protein [Halothiobacillaceae bacterium]|nr:putative phage abortive infection protein [Halothiobacillaceae bacterium]
MKYRDLLVLGIVLLVFATFAGALLWNIWPIEEISVAKSGLFGDSFGALNALFSGLAFGGLLITVLYQREDLGLTKQELKLTRDEIKAQHLETTFFHMLRLHQDVVTGIDLHTETNGEQREIRGRDCFRSFHRTLKSAYNGDKTRVVAGDYSTAYDYLWRGYQSDLGHYFRGLYTVFKYLSEHDFNDKKQYGNIARAQLSDFELVILFYNCLGERGRNFIRYANEFAIFDNLDVSLLLDKEHVRLLDREAFGHNSEALTFHSTGSA